MKTKEKILQQSSSLGRHPRLGSEGATDRIAGMLHSMLEVLLDIRNIMAEEKKK